MHLGLNQLGVKTKNFLKISLFSIPKYFPPFLVAPPRVVRNTTVRHHRYALRGLLVRLDQESGHPNTDRFSLDGGPSDPWGNSNGGGGGGSGDVGAGVGRMPPPAGNALETAGLLALERQGSSPTARGADGGATAADAGASAAAGHGPGGLEGGGDDGDDEWELQKSLLLSEYREGERGMVVLMENLIAVRVFFCLFELPGAGERRFVPAGGRRGGATAPEALLVETKPFHVFSRAGDIALGHTRHHRTYTASSQPPPEPAERFLRLKLWWIYILFLYPPSLGECGDECLVVRCVSGPHTPAETLFSLSFVVVVLADLAMLMSLSLVFLLLILMIMLIKMMTVDVFLFARSRRRWLRR